jgi:hypothetical protein
MFFSIFWISNLLMSNWLRSCCPNHRRLDEHTSCSCCEIAKLHEYGEPA